MQRDFVIQVRQDIDLHAGHFEGRIEHIDSGRSAHFRTIEDLLAFVVRSIAPAETSVGETDGAAPQI
jgi:hypothetical protein